MLVYEVTVGTSARDVVGQIVDENGTPIDSAEEARGFTARAPTFPVSTSTSRVLSPTTLLASSPANASATC
jgi:hypothetical protein